MKHKEVANKTPSIRHVSCMIGVLLMVWWVFLCFMPDRCFVGGLVASVSLSVYVLCLILVISVLLVVWWLLYVSCKILLGVVLVGFFMMSNTRRFIGGFFMFHA